MIIQIDDKKFRKTLSNEEIQKQIKRIAEEINTKHKENKPVFLIVLKGAFMFASDLLKNININNCEIEFLSSSSYHGGLYSQGDVQYSNIPENLKNRNIIIVEDIVDTGRTITGLKKLLQLQNPKSIEIATLFKSKLAHKNHQHCDYVCLENDDFIVGYGLDYKEQGRNLNDIYTLKEEL